MLFWSSVVFGIIYFILIVITIGIVMLDNHQPSESVAWIALIVALPILGPLLYYFFGQNIRRSRLLEKRSLDLLTRKGMAKYVQQAHNLRPQEGDMPMLRFFKRHNMSLPFDKNQGEFLTQGSDFLGRLLHDIDAARHHVHLEFFIFLDDGVGTQVADALARAAGRGVRVRLIYDDMGCWKVPNRFWHDLRRKGIQAVPFMPVRFPAVAHRINYRNHRKLVVIDGRLAYIGGMNIAQRYVDGMDGRPWRDLMMRLTSGGCIYGIQMLFLADWYMATHEIVDQSEYYPSEATAAGEGALGQIVFSAPISKWPVIMMGYQKIILSARKSLLIQSPYLIPTVQIRDALQTASMSGVRIQIMIPQYPDSRWLRWANNSYVGDMLKAGAEVYLYKPGMMHAKMLLADDHLLSIGSVNMDARSMLSTFESSAVFYDDQLAQRARELFMEARAQCTKIDIQQWRQRKLHHRLTESFVRIFTPLL
ncbi:MAG: cardiolipin synthase [Bacteroidaceae bacterium]|nr:cardiolipin synthase [Bacteroidaceae bacterium]